MMYQMARMSVEDGLVMTIHPGSYRNHHEPTFNAYGADTGHDIPFAMNYTEAIRPLLQDFGTAKDFHLVLFTMDETVFSRELAPLAGFYPSVYLGAPWWFLDAPDAMLRFRSAVTETAGFSRSSGSSTTPGRSVPSPPGTTLPGGSRRPSWPVSSPNTGSARTAPTNIIVDIVELAPKGVQAMSIDTATPRRHPHGICPD